MEQPLWVLQCGPRPRRVGFSGAAAAKTNTIRITTTRRRMLCRSRRSLKAIYCGGRIKISGRLAVVARTDVDAAQASALLVRVRWQ